MEKAVKVLRKGGIGAEFEGWMNRCTKEGWMKWCRTGERRKQCRIK
jgi:hypothetical protein